MTNSLSDIPIVDTHAHLDDRAFDEDRNAVLEASRAVGVRRFINIGCAPDSWESTRVLRDHHKDIEISVGLHPQQAQLFGPELARELRKAIRELRPIAIGETGFDFSRSTPLFTEQLRAFRGQLEMASSEALPTIIHQRDAADALIAELEQWPKLDPIVLHSFDGTRRLTDWAIERGCYIGIGGLATKRSSGPLRDLLAGVPISRLLLESDSPYLAPPDAANRRNTPANLPLIAGTLGLLWNLTGEELCWITSRTAFELFRIPFGDDVQAHVAADNLHATPVASRDFERGETARAPGARSPGHFGPESFRSGNDVASGNRRHVPREC